jgi:hypothetical protein
MLIKNESTTFELRVSTNESLEVQNDDLLEAYRFSTGLNTHKVQRPFSSFPSRS